MNTGPVSTPPGSCSATPVLHMPCGIPLLGSVLKDMDSWASLMDPGPPSPSEARPSTPLTLPAGVPVLQGVSHPSPAPLLGPLLCLPPLLESPPPQAHHSPAALVPGPAGSQLSPGPLGHCPVAPAEEDAEKGSVRPKDGHCHGAASPAHASRSSREGLGVTLLPVSILGESRC